MIQNNIENLKQQDFYSLLLFALYKLNNVPEYSALSQLSFVLDKDNLLNLCEYFGGATIRIPTTKELESLTYSLLLYQYVKIDGMDYTEACNLIGHDSCELRQAKKGYRTICDILEKYSFKPQNGVQKK